MTNTPTIVLPLEKIKKYLSALDLIPIIETGFVALSKGKAVVPPVGELIFKNPPGEAHIKYGYIADQPYYVIKIASGFYENPKLSIASSQGLMLLFSKNTGELLSVLLDEGYLTDLRTVIASMITIKHLAPKSIRCIGIVGTGTQARLQLKYLSLVTDCKDIIIWGRNPDRANKLIAENENLGNTIKIARDIDELARKCNVIITTTPSNQPLLGADQINSGTHITALGSDTSEKSELAIDLIQKADLLVSDSIEQSKTRGEIYQARKNNCLDGSKLLELGSLILNPGKGRKSEDQITIADLTGVAVQDIMIASEVYNQHKTHSSGY